MMRRNNIRSLYQLLSAWPVSYLMAGLATLIFLYFSVKETTRNKPALPDECNEFELLDGNLESSKIILLGEYHALRNITVLCLQALTKMMMLSQFSVYLEGIFTDGRVTQFHTDEYKNSYGLLCKQPTVYCQTWENIVERSKTEMFYHNYRNRAALTTTAIFLNQLAISDHEKLQLIKQSFHENTQLSEAMYAAVDYWPSTHFEEIKLRWLTYLEGVYLHNNMGESYQAKHPGESFFQVVFNMLFDDIRNRVEKECAGVDDVKLSKCNFRAGIKAIVKIRDTSLYNNIKLATLKKYPSFFIAGGFHAGNISTEFPKEPQLAILRMKPGL